MAVADPEELAERYRELLVITRRITSTLDQSVVMSTVTTQAAHLLNGDAAVLLLRDRGELRVACVHNLHEPAHAFRVPVGPDMMTPIRELGHEAGLDDCVCVTLALRGDLIGMLVVFRRDAAASTSEDHVLLSALADHAAIALENAHNCEQVAARSKAVHESEQLFRLALEEAPIGVALVGLDGRFLRVNNVLCEMTGYSREELTRLTFQAITHPDDIDTDLALAQQLARGDIPRYQLAKRYLRKDGTPVDIMLSGSVARSPEGAPLYFIAHIEDITERKQVEDRLRLAQERYELALRGADLAAWDWNIPTGHVVFSARWAEMRGYRLDEVKPHVDSWIDGVHPDDRPGVMGAVKDYFEGRIPDYETEHRVATKSGDWIWILDRGKVFARDAQGRPTRMVGTELDITQRKFLEQTLRETNADLDRAQSVAKTGSWRLDVRRNVLTWSEESYRIFGVAPGTPLTYEVFLGCVHPEDREYVDRMWSAALQGAPYDIEHRLLVSGNVKWVREKADLEHDEHGALVGGIGITQDITERKHAEEALRLAEARSSGILSVSADAIISIDRDYRITLFNDGAVAIFGFSKEEAVGASMDLLVPERFRAQHRRLVEEFAAGPETARRLGGNGAPIVGLRKNGEEFPADAAISKLDVGGTRILTLALRDITEQTRHANEQRFLAEAGRVLAASLEYEETLLRVAELAVADLADVCVVDIVEESGEIRRLKVISRDPRLADVCDRLEHFPIDRERPFLLRTTLDTRRSLLIERASPELIASLAQNDEHHEILRAIAPRSMITVPLLAYDTLVGGLGLISSTPSRVYGPADVRLAEELARRAALSIENARLYRKARRAIQARDDVLGIVAHDLRNPLNAVRLQAQLFHAYGGESPEQARKAAEMIDRATRRMDRLIEDLLDVSRVEAGRFRIEQARISPAELVADSLDTQKPLVEKASMELRLEIESDLPDVWADRNRLLQLLENLVTNAIKFTEAGGRITLGAATRGSHVLFWVRDTGTGIPEDALEHVFDRFWQARQTDRRGAGLGLAISRGIVEAHGGHIWAESTLGKGTTFYFTIPVAPPLYAGTSETAPSAGH